MRPAAPRNVPRRLIERLGAQIQRPCGCKNLAKVGFVPAFAMVASRPRRGLALDQPVRGTPGLPRPASLRPWPAVPDCVGRRKRAVKYENTPSLMTRCACPHHEYQRPAETLKAGYRHPGSAGRSGRGRGDGRRPGPWGPMIRDHRARARWPADGRLALTARRWSGGHGHP